MKIVRRISSRLRSVGRRWLGDLYRAGALWQARANGGRLTIPGSCRLSTPLRCNGAGQVVLGENVNLGFRLAPMFGDGSVLLQARSEDARISIGSGTTTSNNVAVIAQVSIEIGTRCRIGDQVVIYDCDFHEISPETRDASNGATEAVRIGDNVWLGSRVMILKGVEIGDHCVIAAGAVVTGAIPARSVAAGNPARVVRSI